MAAIFPYLDKMQILIVYFISSIICHSWNYLMLPDDFIDVSPKPRQTIKPFPGKIRESDFLKFGAKTGGRAGQLVKPYCYK